MIMTDSNNEVNEIDSIISRAIEEYNRAHGIASTNNEEQTNVQEPIEEPTEEVIGAPIIPANSTSALISEATSRFSSAIWYDKIKESTITLAGVGGIGSYIAFLLARMQPRLLYIYDDDIVEEANMSGQLYGTSDVGRYKVDSIVSIVREFAKFNNVFSYRERFTEESAPSNIMICGFDNMEARKIFFNTWVNYVYTLPTDEAQSQCLFIDGRLAAEEFQVFAINGLDDRAINEYQSKWLFSDSAADATICSYKQTTFCANMIGSIIVNLFVNFIANQCDPLVPRDVPFMTTYNAETMFFKVLQ